MEYLKNLDGRLVVRMVIGVFVAALAIAGITYSIHPVMSDVAMITISAFIFLAILFAYLVQDINFFFDTKEERHPTVEEQYFYKRKWIGWGIVASLFVAIFLILVIAHRDMHFHGLSFDPVLIALIVSLVGIVVGIYMSKYYHMMRKYGSYYILMVLTRRQRMRFYLTLFVHACIVAGVYVGLLFDMMD